MLKGYLETPRYPCYVKVILSVMLEFLRFYAFYLYYSVNVK